MALQPDAIGVIHATWPFPSIFESTYHDPDPDNTITNYSRRVDYDLMEGLRIANPGRTFVSDRVNEMLDSIYHDIEAGIGPLTDFGQMFRDVSGHMSEDNGQSLQHNAMRQAFLQATGIDNSTLGVDPEVKEYLDAKILAFQPVPEPGALIQQGSGVLALLALAKLRRQGR